MPMIDANGVNLWYQFTGEGETVVQIGGAVSAHEGYATITPGLSQHYRVLDYDHRGYGGSDRPAQRYTLDTWSDDLDALMAALGIGRAHIHGAGAVGRCDRMGVLQFRVWQSLARAYGVASVELAEQMLTHAFSRTFLDGPNGGDDALAAMQDVTARNVGTDVFIDACQAMIDTDVTDRLGDVTAPTLVMVGSEDVLTPVDAGPGGAGARYVAESLPNARLVVFEGSGHGHYIEHEEESVAVILDFLAG